MRKIFFIFLSLLFLNGCGIIDYYFLTPPEDTAQELFENAQAHLQDKNYGQAIESLSKLNDGYPFSPYAVQARLMLGDAYYLDKQYVEAVDVYEEFLSMHPRHESVDYVLFQIGVCKYNAYKSIDLPQTGLEEAVESLRRLVESYPQSAYREEAIEYIAKCRKMMAEHELYVADFYFKSKSYKAAWMRYSFVLENFPELPEVVSLAEEKAKIAYFYYQQQENDTQRHPNRFKKFFNWL